MLSLFDELSMMVADDTVDNALLFIPGFTQPEHRVDGTGLWRLMDYFKKIFPDRTKTWIGLRPWNSKQLKHDVTEICRLKARRIIIVCYSWGCGKGLFTVMEAFKKAGKKVIVILIDPVIYGRWIFGRLSNAMWPSKKLFELPDDGEFIEYIATFRTVNYVRNKPWGRDVREGAAKVLKRMAFGSIEALEKWEPMGDWFVDGHVHHTNIDNDNRVHREIVSLVSSLLSKESL